MSCNCTAFLATLSPFSNSCSFSSPPLLWIWYSSCLCVLQENASSEEHVLYVWDHFVSRAEAKNVFIVAHSYGGLSFVELVSVLVFPLFLPSFLPPTYWKTHRDTVHSWLRSHINCYIPTFCTSTLTYRHVNMPAYPQTCMLLHINTKPYWNRPPCEREDKKHVWHWGHFN